MSVITFTLSLLLLSRPAQAQDKFIPFDAYLDVEERQTISVFNYPDNVIEDPKHKMENWKYCEKLIDPQSAKERCKNAVGWLPRDATIRVIGDKIVRKTVDPLANEEVKEEYYKISFSYWVTVKNSDGTLKRIFKKGEGYVEAAILSKEDRSAFFATKNESRSSKVCDAKGKCVEASLPKKPDAMGDHIQDLATKERINNISVIETADRIFDLIGECNMQSAGSISQLDQKVKNTFDHFVLPQLKYKMNNLSLSEKKSYAEIKNEKGLAVDHASIIDIEALARTMYAEMGRCFKNGLQYPMAVARITSNRSTATCALKNGVFIQGKHETVKNDLAKAATSPRQFNLWLKSEGKRKNGPLLQALCPPKSIDKKYYTGGYPSNPELFLWRNSVRIATEAVLYPNRFANRTEELEARYYYTSGMGQFFKLEQVVPAISGRKLDNANCMEIWRDLAQDRLCNGNKTPAFDLKNPPKNYVPVKRSLK